MLRAHHTDEGAAHPRRTGAAPGETGASVVLAALVLMVMALVGAAMFTDANTTIRASAHDRNLAQARAGAELAVAEAFARIDAGDTGALVGEGTVDDLTYRYRATAVGDDRWLIAATAEVDGVTRALEADVTRDALHPHTLFVVTRADIDRNTGTVEGRFGTNGTVDVTGPAPGETQELYRPDAVCDGCTGAVALDGPRTVTAVTLPGGATRACPDDGVFTGELDGDGGTPVVCDADTAAVTFDGEVIVTNPPLVVYVAAEVALALDGATVNATGDADDFALFVAGDPDDAVGSLTATGADITGSLYAPGRSLTTADTTVTGTITIGTLALERTGNLTVAVDDAIATLGSGSWRLSPPRPVSS